MKKQAWNLGTVICCTGLTLCLVASQRAVAQSGTRAPQRRAAAKAAVQKGPFEVQFWDWLSKANYQHWAAPAGESADKLYPGKSPHGAFIRTHLNRAAASNPKAFPQGSVIVKENFNKDKKLMSVTVMSKSNGYDPVHKDWWYAKYMPDGKIAMMKQMKIAGKVGTCVQCHSNADGDDYVYTNDQP